LLDYSILNLRVEVEEDGQVGREARLAHDGARAFVVLVLVELVPEASANNAAPRAVNVNDNLVHVVAVRLAQCKAGGHFAMVWVAVIEVVVVVHSPQNLFNEGL
jgi:2-C-methyl-D-erythritol 4-phosphate cytidylyltransferase